MRRLTDAANRYPSFLQEFGRSIWEVAPSAVLTEEDAVAAVAVGTASPDQGFLPTRAKLIAKGVVYAPEHGRIAFTVPMMADHIVRQHSED